MLGCAVCLMLFVCLPGSGLGLVLCCVLFLLGCMCVGCVAVFALCLGLVWFVVLLVCYVGLACSC